MPLLVYSVRRKCHHSSTSNIHMPQSSSSRIPVAKVSVVNHYCLKPLALVFHLLYQRRFSSQKNKGNPSWVREKGNHMGSHFIRRIKRRTEHIRQTGPEMRSMMMSSSSKGFAINPDQNTYNELYSERTINFINERIPLI